MMDHQNIAKVHDAGTTESGRPYFVMELVHGVPITDYCDANQLTPRQRLELFVPVCQASGYHNAAWVPEIDPRRYAPHFKLPVLMLNGNCDAIFPLRSSQTPLFRHLGSADKQHKILPAGHCVPAEEAVRIADEWLRSRLGPADRPPDAK
jgi:pimeloyl-ACP methyl ester carboxylesterase